MSGWGILGIAIFFGCIFAVISGFYNRLSGIHATLKAIHFELTANKNTSQEILCELQSESLKRM